MLTIKGKAIGSRKPLFADFSVPPPEDIGEDGSTVLRVLIASVVRHEVAEFKQRQIDRQFIRVLTEREIEEGEAAGKIESGGSDIEVQNVDIDDAIQAALQAFDDGLFFVVVDDQQQKDLDSQVFVRPDSELTFIRLTLLAGG